MRTSSLIRRFVVPLLLGALALGGLGVASACNVPVFRYALEHWRADQYRLVLVHRGPLDKDAQELANSLEEQQQSRSAAFTLLRFDLNDLEDTDQQRVADLTGELTLPALVVQYPERVGIQAPFWKGSFSRDPLALVTQSPTRQELVRRLAQGQTAVWLLLECGDRAQDDAAAELLDKELKRLEKELKLPELTEAPEDNLETSLPLAIKFSVLRVARSQEEAALVQMLLGSEPDLKEQKVPLVFPVFGRGRALLPMIGKGITGENTKDYAEFLVSACSCEVKEQNPGFDLLLTADWEDELAKQGVRPTATEKPAAPKKAPELVPIPPGAAKKVKTTDARALRRASDIVEIRRFDIYVGIVGAIALASAGWLWLRQK